MECVNQSFVTAFILAGFSEFSPYLQHILFMILLVVYVASLTGNMMIIILVSIDSILQTPMYLFLRNLSLLEIIYISITVPRSLFGFHPSTAKISSESCAVQMFLFSSMGSTECLFLAMMAYDRHVAICNPLRYTVIMRPRICTALMIFSWLWGAVISTALTGFTFSLPYCGSNVINHFYCDITAVMRMASVDTFQNEVGLFTAAMAVGICPLMLIIFSYVGILVTILRMKSAAGRRKAFSTCGSHLFSLTLFYGTSMCTYLRIGPSDFQERDKMLALLYTVVTPMLNPVIYSLRNRDVKIGLNRLVRKIT